MPKSPVGLRHRSLSSFALNSDDYSQDTGRGRIIFLSGIAARDDAPCRGICIVNTMCAKPIFTVRERHITAPQLLLWHRSDDQGVAIENVWFHALTLGTEPHMDSAIEERFANRGELRGV